MNSLRHENRIKTLGQAAGIFLRSLPLAAILLVPTAGFAKSVSLGSMTFEAPDAGSGWTVKPVKNGMILEKSFPKTEENRKGAAMIQVLGPFAASAGSFDKDFETMAGLVTGMAEERPMTKSEGVTANGHRVRSDYRCCVSIKEVSAGQHTVGIASKKHSAFFAMLDLELRGEAQDSADADFAAIIRSIRLDSDDRPFELVPRYGDGGLDGVYTHLETGIMPNAFGGTDFYSNSEITVFDPSGLYATELPKGGDIRAHCRAEPTDCGLYSLKGESLVSTVKAIEMRAVADEFGVIEVSTKPFAASGDGLTIDKASYSRVPPASSGTPFEGTWRYFFASTGSTAMTSGGVSAERILTLKRDGSFRRTGWSGGTSTSDVGGGSVGVTAGRNKRAESGRYKVDGYTLELDAGDGRIERLSLFAPDTGSDELLVIDGANYLKED